MHGSGGSTAVATTKTLVYVLEGLVELWRKIAPLAIALHASTDGGSGAPLAVGFGVFPLRLIMIVPFSAPGEPESSIMRLTFDIDVLPGGNGCGFTNTKTGTLNET